MSALGRWLVLIAAMIPQVFTWGFSVAGLAMWAVPWMETYGASHSQIMATSTCTIVGVGVLAPLGGYIAERFSVRNSLAAGVILFALAYLLISRATTMWQITLLCALLLAAGLVLTSAMMGQILAVKFFDPKPGLAIGIMSMGPGLGGIIAPLIIHKLLSLYTWQTAYALLAVCSLVFLPIIFLTIPKISRAPVVDRGAVPAPNMVHVPRTTILSDRVFIGSVMVVMMLNFLYCGVFYNLGPYFLDIGVDRGSVSRILSVMFVPTMLGNVLFPVLAERFDYRLPLLIMAVLMGSSVAGLAASASLEMIPIFLLAMGLVVGGTFSVFPAIMAQRFGRGNFERATSLGLPFIFSSSVGSFVVGLGRDMLGSYSRTFALLVGFIIIPVLGLLLLSTVRTRKTVLAGELPSEI